MGFGNSNNWQTEAELRNARLAKQTSLDKLLEHVNWNPKTLTLSLDGITLSWGDIEGTDDVVRQEDIADMATKSEIPSDAYITAITKNTIQTEYLTANHLTIKGGSVQIKSGANTNYIELTDTTGAYNLYMSPSGITMYGTNGSVEIVDGSIHVGSSMSSMIKIEDGGVLTVGGYQVVRKKENGFPQCTGEPNSMVCIVSGELRYITKSTIKSWLGIS